MENIGDLLSGVLSDPAAMEKLKKTAEQLGINADMLSDAAAPQQGASPSVNPTNAEATASESLGANGDMIAAMAKITPLLSKLKEEDDMTRLIHALRPYLSGSRRKKAEEADKLMLLMRLIPLLKKGGL